eukprot:Sspe_Gene.95844::Locus_68164_Transcript_3_4_Confidence_0.625_Length_463::g.95844::m.95844
MTVSMVLVWGWRSRMGDGVGLHELTFPASGSRETRNARRRRGVSGGIGSGSQDLGCSHQWFLKWVSPSRCASSGGLDKHINFDLCRASIRDIQLSYHVKREGLTLQGDKSDGRRCGKYDGENNPHTAMPFFVAVTSAS